MPLIVGSGSSSGALPAASSSNGSFSGEDADWPTTPLSPAAGAHYLLIADVHSTPLAFADMLQTDAGDDFLYSD